jgi:hypothetical protein
MKTLNLSALALAAVASLGLLALSGGAAQAGPGWKGKIDPTFSRGPIWGGHRPHGHRPHWGHRHGGGYGGAYIVGSYDDDCYFVKKRIFVPGYGVIIKRRQVCG